LGTPSCLNSHGGHVSCARDGSCDGRGLGPQQPLNVRNCLPVTCPRAWIRHTVTMRVSLDDTHTHMHARTHTPPSSHVHHVRDGPPRGRSRNANTSCPWVTNARTFVACALQDAADGLDVVGGDHAPLTHAVQVQLKLKPPLTHSRTPVICETDHGAPHTRTPHTCDIPCIACLRYCSQSTASFNLHDALSSALGCFGSRVSRVLYSHFFLPCNCHQIFRCDIDCAKDPNNCISETLYKQQADAMVAQDFVKFGYDAIHMDDCVSWQYPIRPRYNKLEHGGSLATCADPTAYHAETCSRIRPSILP
jgi:hypothetical protein